MNFYRKDLFSKANISAPPQTWDEVLGILRVLNGMNSFRIVMLKSLECKLHTRRRKIIAAAIALRH